MGAAAPGALAVSFETGRRYHVHKSYPLLTSAKAVLAIIVAVLWTNAGLVVSLASEGDGQSLLIVAAGSVAVAVLAFGALFGVGMLAWRNMSFAFDDREFSYHQGIIVKKRVHVPYERVQSVNHKATLFQRLFGLCTVTIDTAGGSANKAIGVPYVTLGVAERLRTDLFARKAALAQGIPVRFDSAQAAEGAAADDAQALFGGSAGARDASPASPDVLAAQQAARAEAPNALDGIAADAVNFRGAFAGQRFGEEPVSYECGLTNGQLLLAGLTDAEAIVAGFFTTVVLAITFGFGASRSSVG